MDSADRPAVMNVGAEVHYRASALGSCTRALAAARQELEKWEGETPASVQKAYDAGHDAEPKVLKDLLASEWVITGQQVPVRLQLTPKLVVTGTIDLTGISPQKKLHRVIEVKRQNDDEFQGGAISDSMWWYKYKYQLSVYMIAIQMPALVARVNDAGQMKYETYLEPPVDRAGILARVMEVEKLARADLRLAECSTNDFPCPYWKLLHPGRGDDGVERYEVDDAELAAWIVHYARVKGDSAELKKVEKSLHDQIVERVKQGITRDRTTGVAVRVTQNSVGQRVTAGYIMTRVTPILPAGQQGDGEVSK